MTVIAALKKHGEMWMVADRETSYGDFVRRDQLNGNKIIRFKNALIASAGLMVYKNALRYYVHERYDAPFESEKDVQDFFFEFYEFVKEKYDHGGGTGGDVGRMNSNSFLVVTADLIYEVSNVRCVSAYDNYTAIGNGSEIFMGAMHALNPLMDEAPTVLGKAYETACHFIHGCGGEMELLHVPTALLHEPIEADTAPIRHVVPAKKRFVAQHSEERLAEA